MNRRLPAEVVTRRRPTAKKPEEKPTEEVTVDLKTYLTLRPEARIKWLGKAIKMAEDGKTATTDLFDIVASRKFSGGIPAKVGRKLWGMVMESCNLFSDKQQRYLRSEEWAMTAKFGGKEEMPDRNDDKDDDEVDDAPDGPDADESKKDGKSSELAKAEPDGGIWTSVEQTNRKEMRAKEETANAKRTRSEAFERMERSKWMAEEAESSKKREIQQQQDAKRQAEEEADSSLMLLDRLFNKNKAPSPEPEPIRERERERPRKSRRDSRDRRRGMSRSRSISIQRSPSRKRGRGRSSSGSRGRRGRRDDRKKKNRGDRGDRGGGGDSLQDLIRKRMAEREAEMDSARVPVVEPGHAQRWN